LLNAQPALSLRAVHDFVVWSAMSFALRISVIRLIGESRIQRKVRVPPQQLFRALFVY